MAAYQYVAVDSIGKEHKGILEGDTARHVRQQLRERQLLPVEVSEVAGRSRAKAGTPAPAKPAFALRRGISPLDLALVTRQLATLVRSGLPLDEALLAVGEQTEKARTKSILSGVRAKVVEGHPLAAGLDDYPQVFPAVYRATVAAGEQAGQLDTVLERLADYTESRHALRQKVSHALIYPIALTTLALGIIVLMLMFVVPKVVSVFETTGQELPLLTQALISLSDFLQIWWPLLAAVVIAAVLAANRALRAENVRRRVHAFMLRVPFLGRVTRGLNTARFTRTLSILTASGVPALEALKISGSVVSNLPMRDAVEAAAVRVREGGAIGRSLSASKLFPPMSIHLISSGESSGNLDRMLERAASHQESEMDSLLGTMLSVLEPALIISMGVMVLTIVMAILLPIFQINELIS